MARGFKTGGGSRKGKPNRTTSAAKEAFSLAFEGLGGVGAFTTWARRNPTDFYKLYARLIPVESHVGGPDGGAIPVAWPLPPHPLEVGS